MYVCMYVCIYVCSCRRFNVYSVYMLYVRMYVRMLPGPSCSAILVCLYFCMCVRRCFNRWCTALKRCRALRQLVTAKTRSLKESAFHQWRERVCRNEAERTALIHQRLCVLKRSFAVWKGRSKSVTHTAR